jgi:hypothetical protein
MTIAGKKTKLHLIKGGKTKGSGGKGGSPPPGGGSRGRRAGRRPNPLNKLLWYATSRAYYTQRATSTDMIAERMTKLSRRVMGREIRVATGTASLVIDDCRRRHNFYGWTLMHVEKGSIGWNRGYVPVLMEVNEMDEEVYLIDDEDLNFAIKGLRSSVGTIESMAINDADGLTFLIGCLEALGLRAEADRFREFAAECRAFARRAAEIRKHAEAL